MMSLPVRDASGISSECDGDIASSSSKQTISQPKHSKKLLPNILTSPLSIFGNQVNTTPTKDKLPKSETYGWTSLLRKIVTSYSMWRIPERFLGCGKADVLSSTAEVWLLGKCYKVSSEELSSESDHESGHAAFLEDFASRIWITYRKGFEAIGDSKYTSDVNWGCMIRSSQMLVAQGLLFHHLGRSWRKPLDKPYNPEYIEILHLFGDSEVSAFSIHNLVQAGKNYGLAVGSWVGPYAMCRAWETLIRENNEKSFQEKGKGSLPMVLYVVSGDEDGERGGAPVVCIDVASRLCSLFNKGQSAWAPILLLVPLVLGLEKVNPRYIPLLKETFTFPQSLGILGGRPASSTYMIGVQEDKALYLDPHENQMVVNIAMGDLEADTSSYHCSTIRDVLLEQIDPSLAIGFYCRDKDEFDDFCSRASALADKANGAPLFTVAKTAQPLKPLHDQDIGDGASTMTDAFNVDYLDNSENTGDDEWQIL